MGRLIRVRVEVDQATLTDELLAYVTDPSPARNERPVLDEGREHNLGIALPLLECMVVDGVDSREPIAELVHYWYDRYTSPAAAPTLDGEDGDA
jgi:hypothetical protein